MTVQFEFGRNPQISQAQRDPAWQDLRPSQGLRLDVAACLPLRYRGAGCKACVETCPTAAIQQEEGGLLVSSACTGCARCVAACPMGALESQSLAAPPGNGTLPPLNVECWRVPSELRLSSAVSVPCLGGLDAAWLVRAHGAAGDGPVLHDHGLCDACPSGDGEGAVCPVKPVLEQVRDLLEYMGVAPQRLPRRSESRLPDGVTAMAERGADNELALSRRAFLGQLGRRSGEAAAALYAPMSDPLGALKDARLARPPHHSRSRQRLLTACLDLVKRGAYGLPQPLLHGVTIDSDCCDSGLCSAVCPTGALWRATAGGKTQVLFSALRCIGCRACERACPQQAFSLHGCLDDGWQQTRVVVSRSERDCAHCGASFTAIDDASACDACTKSQALARSLFRHMFAGAVSADNTKGSGPAHGTD